MYLAIQLLQRKLVAWWLAVGATISLIILHSISYHSPISLIYYATALLLLLLNRDCFRARSEIIKIKQGVMIFVASIILALSYGTFGFWLTDKRDFGVGFNLSQSLTRSLREYSLVGNADLHPRNRHADWFLDSLGTLGAGSILFGFYSLFRPLAYEYSGLPAERRKMTALLEDYSTNTEDFFKLWPHDKSYFISSDGQGAIAYGVAGGVALSVGDPAGETAAAARTIAEFHDLCLTHGWQDCYLAYVGENRRRIYENAGYELLKIGEDAVIPLDHFASATAHNKHFRNIRNRFEKAGYTVEASLPPHSPAILREVSLVSSDWLKQPGRKEWRFLTGSFSLGYMAITQLFVVRDETGSVRAFANRIPTYLPGWTTIDLMRYYTKAPNNIMDYLLMEMMLQLRGQGYSWFNLGLAPLAGLASGGSAPQEKLLNLLYQSNQKIISFQGLRRFKNKFEPTWQSRYIAYQGGPGNLPKIAYAVGRLVYKR